MFSAEIGKAERIPQEKTQIDITEMTESFYADLIDINRSP